MNWYEAIGRLAKDPVTKYTTGENGTAVTTFNLAIDRGTNKDGKELGADFIPCKIFGVRGENFTRYFAKGYGVAIVGHLHSDHYENKEGKTIFTLECIVDRWEFLPANPKKTEETMAEEKQLRADVDEVNKVAKQMQAPAEDYPIPEGFNKIDDDSIPF